MCGPVALSVDRVFQLQVGAIYGHVPGGDYPRHKKTPFHLSRITVTTVVGNPASSYPSSLPIVVHEHCTPWRPRTSTREWFICWFMFRLTDIRCGSLHYRRAAHCAASSPAPPFPTPYIHIHPFFGTPPLPSQGRRRPDAHKQPATLPGDQGPSPKAHQSPHLKHPHPQPTAAGASAVGPSSCDLAVSFPAYPAVYSHPALAVSFPAYSHPALGE